MIGRRFALLVPRFFFPYSVFSTAAVKIENTSTVVDGESLELQLLLFNFLSNVNRAASKWLAEILPTTATARALYFLGLGDFMALEIHSLYKIAISDHTDHGHGGLGWGGTMGLSIIKVVRC